MTQYRVYYGTIPYSEHVVLLPIPYKNLVNFLPPEGEDSMSCTSGEEMTNSEGSSTTSTAIKKKMDSLAGSMYGQSPSPDTETEHVYRRRKKGWSVRWWNNKLKSGFRQFLNYRIDQHGEQ